MRIYWLLKFPNKDRGWTNNEECAKKVWVLKQRDGLESWDVLVADTDRNQGLFEKLMYTDGRNRSLGGGLWVTRDVGEALEVSELMNGKLDTSEIVLPALEEVDYDSLQREIWEKEEMEKQLRIAPFTLGKRATY